MQLQDVPPKPGYHNSELPSTAAMRVILAWCANKLGLYVVFFKSMVFISGLIFTHGIVDAAVFSILITYLTDDQWKNNYPLEAAIAVNLQEGTYAVLQIAFLWLADAYTGLFKIVVCSTILNIVGLGLFKVECYSALVLVTFSQAAIVSTLKPFLEDQILPEIPREIAHRITVACWSYVSMLAGIAGFGLLVFISSFMTLAVVSAFAMGAGLLWFLLGTKFYSCAKPTGSPLRDVAHVIYTAAVTNRKAEYPQTPDQLFENPSGVVQIRPHVPWLRWLDRAATIVPVNNNTCTVEQVKGVKFLLNMFPMWSTFLTFSLVSATGSTFFLEEATNIDKNFPVIIFIISQRFTKLVVKEICDRFLKKLGKKMNMEQQKTMLIRIGLGMICCLACCIAAWINAHHWLHLVNTYTVPYMSVYRLLPQYILLGVMGGLSVDGLENFFDSQVSKTIARYGPVFGECVQGTGKFLSALCILILSVWFEWFKEKINSCRLDNYYALLATLTSVNTIIYCFVAHRYGDETFLKDDCDEVDDVEIGSSAQEDDGINLLVTGQEIIENRDDNETENDPVHDVASNAPLLSGSRSFSHSPNNPVHDVTSKGIHKRFYSMRC